MREDQRSWVVGGTCLSYRRQDSCEGALKDRSVLFPALQSVTEDVVADCESPVELQRASIHDLLVVVVF